MNLWKTTHWQKDFHDQSFSLIWIHRKLSLPIKGYQEVDSKMISIKWISTENQSKRVITLTTKFAQTILDFDLDTQKVVKTDGRRSRNWEQTYMDVMQLQWI